MKYQRSTWIISRNFLILSRLCFFFFVLWFPILRAGLNECEPNNNNECLLWVYYVYVRELSWELISVNLSIPVYINNEISSTSIYFNQPTKNSTRKKNIFLTGRKYWWLLCVCVLLPPPHYYLNHFGKKSKMEKKKRNMWPSQLIIIFRMSELLSHSFPKE